MKCLTADKLSQYVDQLLQQPEMIEINHHIKTCDSCNHIVEAFKGEQLFLKETLQTPTLPDDFATRVLDQLEPYKQKTIRPKRTALKRILFTAAGVVLAVGVSTTYNPALAKWIGGLFSSGQVDEGLRLASEAGFTKHINQEVTDNGITLKVEDIIADTSRIAISYQLFNENKKIRDSYFDLSNPINKMTIIDGNGKQFEPLSLSWGNQGEYGLIEINLEEKDLSEKLTIKLNLHELNGKKGNWQIDIPVDLSDSLKATTTVPLQEATTSQLGVQLKMKEFRYSPSANELSYETSYTKEEHDSIQAKIHKLEKQFGKGATTPFTQFGMDLQYHIENEEGKIISMRNSFTEGKGHPIDSGTLSSSGRNMGQFGHTIWSDSFIPEKGSSKLNFILDGIFKTEPTDFSVKIRSNDLKKHPISFEYEGNFINVSDVKIDHDFSLQKSLVPVKKQTSLTIKLDGGKEANSTLLGTWVLVDDKGKSYPVTNTGSSILDEKDEHGRYKTSITLQTSELDEMPEEFTLHLISATRYYELKDKWKLPLY
jgi:hypothetical protein